MAQTPQTQTPSTFSQIAKHPMVYALITVVSVFWNSLDRGDNNTKQMLQMKEEMIQMQDRLYQQMLEEVRKQVTPAVEKVNAAAIKMDSAATQVDSVAQQQKFKKNRR